ncbi:hypothetical protein GCM10022233_42660 [Streptomyces shaanxiensis]|uniref:Uncharacterized protein n=1 Tax=Streptomyces shaanxiensis TaxID=653357 RepID=A0ABP7VCF9_9ACTN
MGSWSCVSTIIPFAKAASIGARTDGGMAGADGRRPQPDADDEMRPHRRDGGAFAGFAYLSRVPPEL